MNNVADTLFEYLKDVLYKPNEAKLNVEKLPEDYQKLGQGLTLIGEWIKESTEFSKAIAKGEISIEPPSVDNVLAAPMKALQGNLRHLTWQAQQIAKGDFSQRVDFMGEFSEAFNNMTSQLSQMTESLLEEKRVVDSKNKELKKNLELMSALTNFAHSMIYVASIEKKGILFKNRTAEWFAKVKADELDLLKTELTKIDFVSEDNIKKEIEITLGDETNYYEVESYHMRWSEDMAVVLIVTDISEHKHQEHEALNMAYIDLLTGLFNRRYAYDLIDKYYNEQKPFILSVIDVDYLKYCNDTFGHLEGDNYLKNIATLLKTHKSGTVCRMGGDEFYIISNNTDVDTHTKNLEKLRTILIEHNNGDYPMSFSYASKLITPDLNTPIDEHIDEIDHMMYNYKRKNRLKLDATSYKDDRLL